MDKNLINENRLFVEFQQTRKHHSDSFKNHFAGMAIAIIMAAVINICIVNLVFFPDCNRKTKDCYLVDYLWR